MILPNLPFTNRDRYLVSTYTNRWEKELNNTIENECNWNFLVWCETLKSAKIQFLQHGWDCDFVKNGFDIYVYLKTSKKPIGRIRDTFKNN